MSLIEPNQSLFEAVKDKVVVITGGANGIGCSAALAFHGHGAKVAVGDVNAEVGKILASSLGDNFLFVKCTMERRRGSILAVLKAVPCSLQGVEGPCKRI